MALSRSGGIGAVAGLVLALVGCDGAPTHVTTLEQGGPGEQYRARVKSVYVTPETASIAVGEQVALTATLKDQKGNVVSGEPVEWSSLDPRVASVSSSGVVSGIAGGRTGVVASSHGYADTAVISVSAPDVAAAVASVEVTPGSASVEKGKTVGFTATLRDVSGNVLTGRTISWTSSNPAVATVSSSGVATGVGAGSATIAATSEGKAGYASLTVSEPATGGDGGGGTTTGSLNEPSGMTVFFSTDGSQRDFGSAWIKLPKWTDDRYTQIVADATNPTGSGTAIEKRWYVGDPTDNGNGLTTLQSFSEIGGFPARELYIRYRVKFSANYDMDPHYGGTKFGYWGSAGRGGASPVQYWTGNANAGGKIFFQDQTGAAPNVNQFGSDVLLGRDVWHTIEIHQVAQSAKGVADGAIKVWVDGTLQVSITGANFVLSGDALTSTYFDGIQIFFIRGTSDSTFRVNDSLRLGELHIGGKK